MKKVLFILGLVFAISMLVPVVLFAIDTFWFLVMGSYVFQPVGPERMILATFWSFVVFVVFAWANRK